MEMDDIDHAKHTVTQNPSFTKIQICFKFGVLVYTFTIPWLL